VPARPHATKVQRQIVGDVDLERISWLAIRQHTRRFLKKSGIEKRKTKFPLCSLLGSHICEDCFSTTVAIVIQRAHIKYSCDVKPMKQAGMVIDRPNLN
jgi:hypothetical protein